MSNYIVIGFSGKAGAGKDEAAQNTLAFLEACRIPVSTYSFAYPLKEVAKFVFGLTEEELSDRVVKEKVGRNTYGLTNRKVMQLLGTECFRDVFNENIWIDVAERNIEMSGSEIVIISDVRFENEAKWVKENGFLFHIDASGREGFQTITEVHSSEAGYEQAPTTVIKNDGTLDQFYASVNEQLHGRVMPAYRVISDSTRVLIEKMQEEVNDLIKETLPAYNEDTA